VKFDTVTLATVSLSILLLAHAAPGDAAARARDLGIPFEGIPGPLNAITDVPGVEVGHVTRLSGEGALEVGVGPIRTGVTVVLPRGRQGSEPAYGGFFALNGNGEVTGQSYLQDFGLIFGPIGISNTNAIGQVYAGIMQWSQWNRGRAIWPLVAETWDGDLNDIQGFHIGPEDAVQAVEVARSGPVQEGNVGGGTGMVCFAFKGGIGTASRRVGAAHFVGVLVQCNTGKREVLRIAGAPVGTEMANSWLPCYQADLAPAHRRPKCRDDGHGGKASPDQGSIIIVVGTNLPLTSNQLDRVARRAALALGRLGSYSGNESGDFIVAFSTEAAANEVDQSRNLDAVFQATVEATEEAIVNALVAARTMTGADGYRVYAIPHDELKAALRRYNRLN
jgi:L-aminopeptidase/D-esterase-like protein